MAQVLPLALYPVFTRMFSPEQFGVFATVSLLATLAALLASGLYEGTILIAPSRRVAAHLVGYTLARSGLGLGVLWVVILLILPLGGRLGVDPAIGAWLPAVPPLAASLVVFTVYSEWCVRNSRFGELAAVRVWQASAVAIGRLAAGTLLPMANGLLAGDLVGKAFSSARCAWASWKLDRPYLFVQTRERMVRAAARHAHVARYLLPDQLVSTLGGSVHVLVLGGAFGAAALGYVTVVLSALYVPVTVVSSAVKDVFRQRAAVEFARDGSCRATYRRLLVPIVALAILGFGGLWAAAPSVFPTVLGAEWAIAAEYARILTPMFFFNFVSMSLGGVLVIAERSDISLAWQVSGLLVTTAALLGGAVLLRNLSAALWCMSLARAGSYAAYMVLSYHYAVKRPRPVVRP